MSDTVQLQKQATQEKSLQGLNCPKCGGMVPVPEGQVVVQCPFCGLSSLVQGERGLLRYQVPETISREGAVKAFRQFLSGKLAVAPNALNNSQVTDVFLVHLPFWAAWSHVMGWVFGTKRVRRDKSDYNEPKEVRIAEDMTWNGAACDTGEFGVTTVPLDRQPLEPFKPDDLHRSGMVFEPVNSFGDAKASALAEFESRVRAKAGLTKITQLFVRFSRQRFGALYYPLWVVRYLYRGRAFQVVVDGNSGRVLYGKAPGNTIYRAAVLVGGMALGALVAIDVPGLILLASNSRNDDLGFLLFLPLIGLGIAAAAYRAFRYGEQYEYRLSAPASTIKKIVGAGDSADMVKEIIKWAGQ